MAARQHVDSKWSISYLRISPIGVEYYVDREVHATAASVTCSCSEQQPEAKQEIYSIPNSERQPGSLYKVVRTAILNPP